VHRLLGRQLRKLGLDPDTPPDENSWRALLAVLERTYNSFDQDRYTLERSLELTSEEMRALHQRERTAYDARLKSIFQSLHEPVWLKDPQGAYLACNPVFEALIGAPESEIIGRTDHDFVSHEDADFFRAQDIKAIAHGGPMAFEEWVPRAADGQRILLATVKTPIIDSDGQLIGVLGIGSDITERRQAERRLQEAASVFHHANEAIILTDLVGCILDVNPAFTEITGYTREETLGSNPRMLKSGLHDERFYIELWQTISRDGRWSGEIWNRRKDGSIFVARQTISGIRDDAGQVQRYVGLFSDYTVLKEQQLSLERLVETRTQDLQVAKEAAEAANRAKTTFLANMSHELRTPITGVIGMIGLARRRLEDAEGIDRLDKAERSAQHLLALLNDILDLSKIEAERLKLETLPLTLEQLSANLLALFAERASSKGLTLDIRHDPRAAGRPYLGDPLRLGQVLINLLGNAIKFSERGQILVSSQLLEAGEEDDLIRFEVSDQGIGIAADAQPRLFAAFEQADGSMTRKYGGTGLGLAISKRLVEMMGGQIGLNSQPGVGSTFWFTVRLRPDHERPVQTAAAPDTRPPEESLRLAHAGARILLTEDEAICREVMLELMDDTGLLIDTASDGEQAVALARQNRYDLILMDMQMPRLNGLDATRAIRADSANRQTPILAMTANVFEQDRQACLDAGMNEHLAKPVVPEVLYASLLKWLSEADKPG
jgi:two-component system, sensor histidine kinase and response regulator